MKRCRLVYRSVAAPAVLEAGALDGLVARAREQNSAAGITGMLLLSGDRFLQVLEGPVGFVNELMARIIADPRHSRFELISYGQISLPTFHDWSMAALILRDLPGPTREILEAKYGVEHGVIRVPDDSLAAHSLLLDARWIRGARAKTI